MSLFDLILDFVRDRRANVALSFGILMPVMVAVGGLAVDNALWDAQKTKLQDIADAAALAGAGAFNDGRYSTSTQRQDAALALAKASVAAKLPELVPDIAVDTVARTVAVSLEQQGIVGFAGIFGIERVDIATVGRALADRGAGSACVLALDTGATVGVGFSGSAAFKAVGCVVWANTTSRKAVTVAGSASVEATQLCGNGGVFVSGANATIVGARTENCGVLPDPLANWSPPVPSGCTANNTKISSSADVVLWPGIYCGGLQASSNGRITLMPGEYHVKNGELKLTGGTTVVGEDVGIYLTGSKSTADISGQAGVRLVARKVGDLRGKVLAAERGQAGNLVSRITGGSTADIVGTVYLPAQAFALSGNSAVTVSPLQQVIAATVDLSGTTSMTMQADFDRAEMPKVTSLLPTVRIDR